eukprot:Gb_11573 [translate_table: standard]
MANAMPHTFSVASFCSNSSSTKFSCSNADTSLAFHHSNLHQRVSIGLASYEGLRCSPAVGATNTQRNFKKLQANDRVFRVSVRATASTAPPLTVPKQKIRIKLRSYWVPLIEEASKQILDAARTTNATTMGPVPLPTKRRIYCVLTSPHVHKDAREHFEIRTHQRLIDVENPNAQTIDALMQLDIAAGVDVEVKLS